MTAGAAPPAAGTEVRRAVSNAGLNLLAGALPFPLALFTVPAVIAGFGVERYGVLATAGVVLAYFALLDVGLGRASTRFMARSIAAGSGVGETFWTVAALAVVVGLAGAAVMLGVASPLVRHLLRVPPSLVDESVVAFRVLAAAVPFAIVLPTLLGALEAQQRFDVVAAIQVPSSALGLLAPLLVLPFTTRLPAAVAAIVAVQAATCVAAAIACRRVLPTESARVHAAAAWELLGFGRWVAISNVVGPLMVNADRLAIGALLSIRAVTFYAVPYDMVTRLQLVPSSLLRALFPLFSADRSPDIRDARRLAVGGAGAIALVMGPLAVFLVALSPELLRLWLGPEFARISAPSLELLAVGVMVNGLALVPYSLLQALGRPDVCAKFHLGELVLYVPMLLLFLHWWGITGAAAAWTVRVTLDAFLLVLASQRLVGAGEHAVRLGALARYGALLVVALALAALAAPRGAAVSATAAVVLAAAALAAGWLLALDDAERAEAKSMLGHLGRARA
ncbi:MAG TPA: flippase [Gemmatimonadales bacterium]|nr:flippase [Gemmatimonadales bacterium]